MDKVKLLKQHGFKLNKRGYYEKEYLRQIYFITIPLIESLTEKYYRYL